MIVPPMKDDLKLMSIGFFLETSSEPVMSDSDRRLHRPGDRVGGVDPGRHLDEHVHRPRSVEGVGQEEGLAHQVQAGGHHQLGRLEALDARPPGGHRRHRRADLVEGHQRHQPLVVAGDQAQAGRGHDAQGALAPPHSNDDRS